MTDMTHTTDLRPGEVVDEHGCAPEGFTLDAEATRTDVVAPGILTREVPPEPDDDEVAATLATPEAGNADDDDAIDDPDEAAPVAEDI
jgi:hypothetical protein